MDEIHFILGNSCNFNCDFCFWERRTPTPNWSTIKHIIDEIVKTDIKKITITGGEPTLSPFFIKTLRYCKNKKLEIVVHSNGSKITKSMVRKISPLINRMSLSIDGSTEEMAINMRKSKFVKHNLLLLDYFQIAQISVCIKTLITKINQDDIQKIANLLKDKKIAYWSLMEFDPMGRGLVNKEKFSISDKSFKKITNKIIKTNQEIPIKIIYMKSHPKPYCFITTQEDVFIDTNNEDVLIGNLKTNSLSKIIKNNFD